MANTDFVSENRLSQEANSSRLTVAKFGVPIALVLIVFFPHLWWWFLAAVLILVVNAGTTLRAGAAGEDRTLALLNQLPDSYTIFNQVYVPNKNSKHGKTELDFIVSGPNGIFVIEVKNNNSKIIGFEKGEWEVRKVGRKGTPYTAKMRNPIRQLRTQVWALSSHLESKNCKSWIEGMVFLSNTNSRFNFDGNPSVKIFHKSGIIDNILDYKPKYPPKNLDSARTELIRLKQA